MIIHVYSVCYNEQDLLPYYLRYYETIADKIVVYDNHSTDKSIEILKAHSQVDLRSYDSDGVNDEVMADIYNECYKESRGFADWIISVDIDEIIISTNTNLRHVLHEMLTNDVMIPHIAGYHMINEKFIKSDRQIYELFGKGVRDPVYDKLAVYRPEININYVPGKHRANPECSKYLLSSFETLALLHYKFFGRQRYLNKQKELNQRVSETNKKNKYGLFYTDLKKADEFFTYTLNCAQDVIG